MLSFGEMGKLTFRTKLMDLEPAARFARCLAANPRFENVEIVISRRAKTETRYFVTWLPVSDTRKDAMADRQQGIRVRRADEQTFTFCADPDHDFCHCHSHSTGEVYETTLQNCSCPDWQFRCRANGLACKHMLALSTAIRRGEVTEFRTIPQPVPQRKFDAQRFEEIFG